MILRRKHPKLGHLLALALISTYVLAGCSAKNSKKKNFLEVVSPWQRQHLSKQAMAWEIDSTEAGLERHIFFSKEATSGGDEATGGGCGCN